MYIYILYNIEIFIEFFMRLAFLDHCNFINLFIHFIFIHFIKYKIFIYINILYYILYHLHTTHTKNAYTVYHFKEFSKKMISVSCSSSLFFTFCSGFYVRLKCGVMCCWSDVSDYTQQIV